jgi:hypothetical protein
MPHGALSRYENQKRTKAGKYKRIELSPEQYARVKQLANNEVTTVAHVCQRLVEQFLS